MANGPYVNDFDDCPFTEDLEYCGFTTRLMLLQNPDNLLFRKSNRICPAFTGPGGGLLRGQVSSSAHLWR